MRTIRTHNLDIRDTTKYSFEISFWKFNTNLVFCIFLFTFIFEFCFQKHVFQKHVTHFVLNSFSKTNTEIKHLNSNCPFLLSFFLSRCSYFLRSLFCRSVGRLASWFVYWLVASIGKCTLRAFRLG